MPTTDEIRQMLAESIAADAAAAATADAAATVTGIASDAIRDAVALLRGADLAGIPVDLATILAAAVDRATPVDPTTLAAVVAPDPVAAAGAPDGRRTRRRVERRGPTLSPGASGAPPWRGTSGRVRRSRSTRTDRAPRSLPRRATAVRSVPRHAQSRARVATPRAQGAKVRQP